MNGDTRRRVLVVEDEPIITRVCVKTLIADGFEVDVAVNGIVARDMVGRRAYDLCFSDIRTPQMNGMELYEYLEQEHPALAERVVFTTGDVLSPGIDAFLKRTDRPFLPKPFTPDELRRVVRAALEQPAGSGEVRAGDSPGR